MRSKSRVILWLDATSRPKKVSSTAYQWGRSYPGFSRGMAKAGLITIEDVQFSLLRFCLGTWGT